MTVKTIAEAWSKADELFPTDYELDGQRTAGAGYPIYYSTADGVNAYICDLGDRLEVNLPDGSSVNIWVKPETETPNTTAADDRRIRPLESIKATQILYCAWDWCFEHLETEKKRAAELGGVNELANRRAAKWQKRLDEIHAEILRLEQLEAKA